MKKQAGFTLIELLLVLAIIGIISAIAIPALLSQRARARDKAAIANLDGVISDCVGQWDKNREIGTTAASTITKIGSYLTGVHSNDKNPWTGGAAYTSMVQLSNKANTASFLSGCGVGSMGQVKLWYQTPTSALPGFIGAAVKTNGLVNGSNTVKRATAIE